MPYTEKQRKFFNLCSHNPEKAQGKGPPKGQARKLAHEANRLYQQKQKR